MLEKKYILFGAGNYGKNAVEFLGIENIKLIIDNSPSKIGTNICGIEICSLTDAMQCLQGYQIVITVSKEKRGEIEQQLVKQGIVNYLLYDDLRRQIVRERIASQPDYITVYKKAIRWVYANSIDGEAIICNEELRKGYPEVTGYFIPSLLRWGHRKLAISYAKWLCRIQKEDGSWYDTNDKEPYIFDSAQILKGLLAIRSILPEVDFYIKRGCDWLISNMKKDGRLPSPRENDFGDERTFSEVIHIYCLSPLVEAGEKLGIPKYKAAAFKILAYYKEHGDNKIMNFSLLSHFYAYVMEGLLDMGEEDMVREAMLKIANIQREDGAVPAYCDVDWICSTGLFQLALVWFRLGDVENGNRAFEYACRLQNPSGGWYGSYATEKKSNIIPDYFPTSEISWAVKYFLDALYWKNRAEFENQSMVFKDSLPITDGRYQVIERVVQTHVVNCTQEGHILDIGCGKGPYLKNLLKRVPAVRYVAVDISDSVMKYIQNTNIEIKQGILTNIPYPDDTFDVVYTCEALEHAVDIESAVGELARVTKSGGKIAIIDKNKDMLGYFEIGKWEQWFDEKELESVLKKYCDKVDVIKEIDYEESSNGLFYAWIGRVK